MSPVSAVSRPVLDYANWMGHFYDILKDKTLSDICLPGTHDSATAHLVREWTNERKEEEGLLIYHGFKNLSKSDSNAWRALLGFARATGHDIKTQLAHGVRAFDFRVWPKDGKFYSVHRFLGEDYEIIVGQLREFLERYKGEVVYARFRFIDGNNLVKPEECKKFLLWITEALKPYLITTRVCQITPPRPAHGNFVMRKTVHPLEMPLEHFTDHGKCSRILIQFDNDKHIAFPARGEQAFPAASRFFEKEYIGLEGDSNGNNNDVKTMIANQASLFQAAKSKGKSCALWLVIGPSDKTCITDLAMAVAIDHSSRSNPDGYSWQALRNYAIPIAHGLRDILKPYEGERIPAIYVDWYEESPLVELAIERSIRRPLTREERADLGKGLAPAHP